MKIKKTTWTLACIACVLFLVLVVLATVNPSKLEIAQQSSALHAVEMLKIVSDHYHIDCHEYPRPEAWMNDLLVDPGIEGWRGPYLKKEYVDPWGTEFEYTLVDGKPVFSSAGPDGVFGNEDDIKKERQEETPR